MNLFKLVLVFLIIAILLSIRGNAATHQVKIVQSMKFVPAEITVKKGDTVVWTNESSMLHNVAAALKKFRSKMLKKGEKFSYTFNEEGLVDYICEPHRAHMKGKVKVEK